MFVCHRMSLKLTCDEKTLSVAADLLAEVTQVSEV